MSLVAIVVPVSGPTTSPDEEISLRHLEHFLGKHDKYLVAPRGASVSRPGFDVMTFSRRYFGSAMAHARLQLSEEFYTRFRDYKYILMHHLDALVLSDRLTEWCEADVDFIGAPWLPCDDSPWVRRPRVGNSGFALMKVDSFLNVMRSTRQSVDPLDYWNEIAATKSPFDQLLQVPRAGLKRLGLFNNVKWEMRRWTAQQAGAGNCDHFWSLRAVHYWPSFKVASFEQGLAFAFEVAPRLCYELNNQRLPFGAHAWARYDRAFWEPYLLQAGALLEQPQ